jgi:hypothetical protein
MSMRTRLVGRTAALGAALMAAMAVATVVQTGDIFHPDEPELPRGDDCVYEAAALVNVLGDSIHMMRRELLTYKDEESSEQLQRVCAAFTDMLKNFGALRAWERDKGRTCPDAFIRHRQAISVQGSDAARLLRAQHHCISLLPAGGNG